MNRKALFIVSFFMLFSCILTYMHAAAQTEITKWQYGKSTAISLTYDDGSPNQFKYALPIMEQLKLPATFFVITGPITGSEHPGKFIGKPVNEIILETATVPTDANNFFERASAARYLGYAGTLVYYDKADEFYESGNAAEAYKVIDTLYEKVRNKDLIPGKDTSMEYAEEKGLSWEAIKKYSAKGYEFASHTVTHAHLAVMDSANMSYELRTSKEEIRKNLGDKYTFSAEVPYGIEDKRVMKLALTVYPALRNLMTDPFLYEINRGYKMQPGKSTKEYVQWQRGPLSKTPLPLMKSWVDTSLSHDNIWLVLVFHGIEGIGWEALSKELIQEYFQFIKQHENKIWVATFGEVARYMRERMNSKVTESKKENKIFVNLTHSLDKKMYDAPLTLKTYVPPGWKSILVKQGNEEQRVQQKKDNKGTYILYQMLPNAEKVDISVVNQ